MDDGLQMKVDLSKAYRTGVARLQKRISESLIPGSMLSDSDVQAIFDDMFSAMVEFALINHAIAPPSEDSHKQFVSMVNTLAGAIGEDYERIRMAIRHVEFHEKPKPTN